MLILKDWLLKTDYKHGNDLIKARLSVATVAKGWSLVYMLMRVRYHVVFFTLETIENFQEEVTVSFLR